MSTVSQQDRLSRRSALVLGLTAPFGSFAMPPKEIAGLSRAARHQRLFASLYTSKNVPDAAGKLALARRLRSQVYGPTAKTSISQSIHRNFPQLIEQGIARMHPGRASAWLKSLSDYELRRIGQLYNLAANDTGHKQLLPNIIATRFTGDGMARIANSVGVNAVYASVASVAPQKMSKFLHSMENPRPVDRSILGLAATTSAPSIDFTIEEIYLSFRTAPIGSLSVQASLFETASFVGKNLAMAWGIGYGIGTGIGWYIQSYFPSTWNFLGETIYNFIESIHTAPTDNELGDALYHGASLFQIEPEPYEACAYLGGDFGITQEWSDWYGGGGGGCSDYRWANCEEF